MMQQSMWKKLVLLLAITSNGNKNNNHMANALPFTLIINNTLSLGEDSASYYSPIRDEVTGEVIGNKYQNLVYDCESYYDCEFVGIDQGYDFFFENVTNYNYNDVIYFIDGETTMTLIDNYIVAANRCI